MNYRRCIFSKLLTHLLPFGYKKNPFPCILPSTHSPSYELPSAYLACIVCVSDNVTWHTIEYGGINHAEQHPLYCQPNPFPSHPNRWCSCFMLRLSVHIDISAFAGLIVQHLYNISVYWSCDEEEVERDCPFNLISRISTPCFDV